MNWINYKKISYSWLNGDLISWTNIFFSRPIELDFIKLTIKLLLNENVKM